MVSDTAAESWLDRSDTPPRKPKQPFLKRGEGVKRRLDAYKYRKQPSGNEQESQSQSTPDQFQQHALPQKGQSHRAHLGLQANQSAGNLAKAQPCAATTGHSSPAVTTNSFLPSNITGQAVDYGDAPGPAHHAANEDLELEEFRALEREIFGSSRSHDQQDTQEQQQQSLQQQEWMHQQQRQQAQLPMHATSMAGDGNDHTAAAAVVIAAAAIPSYGELLSAAGGEEGTHPDAILQFEDDSEWVDTDFSFADLTRQQHAAGQQHAHMQQGQQRQAQEQRQALGQQRRVQQTAIVQDAEQPVHDPTVLDTGVLAQPYVRSLFAQQQSKSSKPTAAAGRGQPQVTTAAAIGRPGTQERLPPDAVAAAAAMNVHPDPAGYQQQLAAEEHRLQQDRLALKKMRTELEKAATRLEQERQAWERQKATAQASIEAWRAEEAKRLNRERRVLEQQSKALLKLPSKKEKSALAAVEAQLEQERNETRAAAARSRLTMDRLRCQIKELQDQNNELHEEVRWHEAHALTSQAFAQDTRARRKPPSSSVPWVPCCW
eukprot:GHRR01017265.1.p1 GENE.GHRR01017265.1~~GHRR01017265.1.p1  ORF type:complete len:545 (+),score=240.41 GHRR01017265.1:917-2551(+)